MLTDLFAGDSKEATGPSYVLTSFLYMYILIIVVVINIHCLLWLVL